jgi:lysophospholipid acyltransferase (LPLAT)-like uncharacterized protein
MSEAVITLITWDTVTCALPTFSAKYISQDEIILFNCPRFLDNIRQSIEHTLYFFIHLLLFIIYHYMLILLAFHKKEYKWGQVKRIDLDNQIAIVSFRMCDNCE